MKTAALHLDLVSLRLFSQVCETRSMARAAEQANIVGSAISKRLAQLEDVVGVPLLVRRRHGVEPTAAGQAMLERVREILAQCEGIERDMAAFAQGVRGQVRILASASAMAESLPSDVARFLQEPAHRHIRIDLEERLSHDVVRGVREGVAAVGICWDAADFQGLATRPYRGDELVVVAPRGHPLAAAREVTFAQTLDYDHVCMPSASAIVSMLQRAAASAGRMLPLRVSVSNFDSAFRVVESGLAVSVVPRQLTGPHAMAHGLAVVALTDAWARRRFALSVRDETALAPAAALVLDYLTARGAEPGLENTANSPSAGVRHPAT